MRRILPLSLCLAALLSLACFRPSPHSPVPMTQPQDFLRKVAALQPDSYDPQLIVDAANALLPLGKAAILDGFDIYLKQNKADFSSFGLFVLLRVLFEPPAGGAHPTMYIGAPDVQPPADPSRLPAFPLMWVEGLPLNLVGGYFLGGHPEHVETHVTHFRAEGTLRTQPLSPAPKASISAAVAPAWEKAYGSALPADVSARITAQIARLR